MFQSLSKLPKLEMSFDGENELGNAECVQNNNLVGVNI